ncbi:ATP-binding protein [Litoribacter populi]|uniref:ATP-binding protein n=1 Tax=Litoribacter populi TaxID=2598460 RepID=UPI001180DE83|nr:ATP-binding protein [Litoribacter populi]
MVKVRSILTSLTEYLSIFPAVGILGPRQVGKTTLVKNLELPKPVIYLDIEKASDRAKLADPELFLKQHLDKTVILDEIQFMPELFAELRSLIDEEKVPARFILLGSASPDLIRTSADSLAGRIGYLELSPFTVMETDDVEILWLRGGFPLSTFANNDRNSFIWRENFIKTYIERDLGLLGLNTDPRLVEKFWTIIAHNQGSTWNGDNIAKSLGVTRPTVSRYLEFLEGSFMIRVLQPYHNNIKKRLVKSPKIYIRDSGILHALASIKSQDELSMHLLTGASWEGFVIEQIINTLGEAYHYYYYRTHQGSECDLMLVKGNKVVAAVEIKNTLAPKITKGFRISMEDLKAEAGIVISRSPDDFPLDKDIQVMSLVSFINRFKL